MPKTQVDKDKIKELLTRGVEQVIVREELERDLLAGKKLRIKLGIDPTGPNLHIGRAIQLWKLKGFQDLGHQIVFIIGDFTGLVGDSSDKNSERPMLTKKQVEKNMSSYLEQVSKILDVKKTEVHYNSKWLGKLNFYEIAELADCFSVAEMIDRENFSERFKKGKRISLREFLYPLMQGYDSVALKADLEIGGTDQTFNLLAGRVIQKKYGQESQHVLTFTLLEGLDGRKMSTSYGNIICIIDPPNEQYGKIMSMKDELIGRYFELVTHVPLEEVNQIYKQLKDGQVNPRDLKARLAWEIVKMYHGPKEADAAAKEFDQVFKEKKRPDKIKSVKVKKKKYLLPDLLVEIKLASSKSEAKRLVEQGGVKLDDQKVADWKGEVILEDGTVVQVGKRRFIKIKT